MVVIRGRHALSAQALNTEARPKIRLRQNSFVCMQRAIIFRRLWQPREDESYEDFLARKSIERDGRILIEFEHREASEI